MAHNVSGASLNGILGRLNQTGNTHPYDAVTFGDWTMQAGDLVTVKRGETEYTSPVHSSRMVWNGAPKVTIQSVGRKEREPISNVRKKKYGRGGAGIRNGERFYHDIYDPTGTVHSEISNTERGFEAKLSGVVDENGNVTAASIATAINAQGQAGVRISGEWIELDGPTIASYLVSQDISVDGLTVDSDVHILNDEGLIVDNHVMRVCDIEKDGNTLTIYFTDQDPITFSKATTLSGEWSGNVAAGKSYKVVAIQSGSTVATNYSPALDGMYTSGGRVWADDYGSFTQKVRVYDEDGEDLLEAEVDFYVTEAYNHAMSFQLGKMVPFVASAANAPYNSKKASITSNGTYYACAEGYKSRTEGYDNANYSSDRYATATPFTVAVPHDPQIDTIWTSSSIPGGGIENDNIRMEYERARADHDNFCIRIVCGGQKNTYYCET